MNELSKNEWLLRYVEYMKKNAGLQDYPAMCSAQAAWLMKDEGQSPEEAADEEMESWEHDGD